MCQKWYNSCIHIHTDRQSRDIMIFEQIASRDKQTSMWYCIVWSIKTMPPNAGILRISFFLSFPRLLPHSNIIEISLNSPWQRYQLVRLFVFRFYFSHFVVSLWNVFNFVVDFHFEIISLRFRSLLFLAFVVDHFNW